MYSKYQHYHAGYFAITVNSCRDGVLSGVYRYPFAGESGEFSGLLELVLKLDRRLDEENTPQAFQSIRCFQSPQLMWRENEKSQSASPEKIAAFTVRVMFRRNATWQGTVTWVEEDQSQHFRSVLELVCLISSAVQTRQMSLQFPERTDCPLELAE